MAVTTDTYLRLPYDGGNQKFVYAVTALDRLQNESKARRKKVSL